MSPRRCVSLLLVLVLALAACGEDEPYLSNNAAERPADDAALDGAWVLTAATVDGQTLSLNEQYRVTMTIDGSEIGGRAACNSYGGSFSMDNDSFHLGDIAVTEMACEPAVMQIESAFLSGLARVTSATRSGDNTSLTGDGVEFSFALLLPVPTAELIGTTWVLDTVIQGDTATSTVAGAEAATLLFDADGTFIGGTGCRDLSGEYTVTGDTVQLNSFRADGECPSDIEWQDGQVITVLESGFTVEITGDRLTATAPGGEGLLYRAQQ
jgi:heat shock protein HslJ